MEAYLDADKTGAGLTVRSRRPGDRLRPLGLGGEKKLQDILVDAKVPARERNAVPLACVGDQIAWVAGHCIDERYAVAPTSRRAIHLTASRRPVDISPDP
jgi:tRNA(Ile)-lysidine synthase